MRGWIVFFVAMGCGGDSDGDKGDTDVADADADADTDADTDADADADADADSDADADTGDTSAPAVCPPVYVPPVVDLDECVSVRAADNNDDGTPEANLRTVYDADGRPSTAAFDFGRDGSLESVTEWDYDAVTGLVTEMREVVSGPPLTTTTTTFTYDAAGLLIGVFEDRGGTAGDVRKTQTNGVCGAELVEIDVADDGSFDTEVDWTWTTDHLTVTTDAGVDGTIEATVDTEIDPVLGRTDRVLVESDATHAGAETDTTLTYDAVTGLLTTSVTATWNGASTDTATSTYSYNAENRETLLVVVSGALSSRYVTVWTCPP